MKPAIHRFSTLVPTPWRNGGGTTREVATAPGPIDFDWRVSIADVGLPGPFSAFVGVDRIIVLIEGPALTLEVDGVPFQLSRFVPFSFRGEGATTCRLPAGPTRDLNVMTRRGRAGAAVVVLDVAGQLSISADEAEEMLVVVLAGRVRVSSDLGGSPVLGALDSVQWRNPAVVDLSGSGSVAVIRLRADRRRPPVVAERRRATPRG